MNPIDQMAEALECISQHRKGYNTDGSYRNLYNKNTDAECGKNWCRVMTLVNKALTAYKSGDWIGAKRGPLLTYITGAVVFTSEKDINEEEIQKEVDRIFAYLIEREQP